MSSRPSRAPWFIILMLLAACQQTDISAEVDEYVVLLNSGVARTCECPEDVGYASLGECLDDLGQLGDLETQCLADALEGEEDAGKGYLDCANVALQDYSDCLESNTGCVDGWNDDCAADRQAALGACPPLPSSVAGPFALCTM